MNEKIRSYFPRGLVGVNTTIKEPYTKPTITRLYPGSSEAADLAPFPCPRCKKQDTVYPHVHRSGGVCSPHTPDCEYWECDSCDYQWGHE